MKTLTIYDPAMCCSSGVCGPDVDETLVHLAGFLKGLDEKEVRVERYNLSQQPGAYAANPTVTDTLRQKGTEALPLVFVNDKLVCSGTYPSTEELADLLQVGHSDTEKPSSDGCSGGCCS